MNRLRANRNLVFMLFLSIFWYVHYFVANSENTLNPNGNSFVEWPLLFDLIITLPLIYYFLFKPTLKQLAIKSLILLSLGIFIGAFVIPESSQQIWPYLTQLRYLVIVVFVLFELSLIFSLLHIIKSSANIESNIEQNIASFVKNKLKPHNLV